MSNHLEFLRYAMPNSRSEQPGEENLSLQNKRKATSELTAYDPSLQKMQITYKRSVEEKFSPKSLGVPQLATPNKRTADVLSKSPKTRSGNMQLEVSTGVQTQKLDPVREKLRESLTAALALVSQNKSGLCNVGKTDDMAKVATEKSNSKPGESAISTGNNNNKESVVKASESSTTFPFDKCDNVASVSQEVSLDGISGDSWKFVGQEFQSDPSFSCEDTPFCDGLFFRDELLQGNGLTWTMDLDAQMSEFQVIESAPEGDLTLEDKDGLEKEQVDMSPEFVACRIESELFKLYGGVNKKYKEKGRSLLFNLKDRNNPELRERVMSGEILPERLCTMTAEELASKELSQWRMAKAEELDHMKVLPNSEGNVRRLVKKTHKGEYQVDFDQDVSVVEDVQVDTSVVRSNKKNKKTDGVNLGHHNKGDVAKEHRDGQDKITIPGEGTDIQGLMVDDMHMPDLPPIMSLDEFMDSLDKEPPFESLSTDSGSRTPEPDKGNFEGGTDSKSPVLYSEDPDASTLPKKENVDVKIIEDNADGGAESKSTVLPLKDPLVSTSTITEEDTKNMQHKANLRSTENRRTSDTSIMAKQVKVEHFWQGLLQLTISSTAYVVAKYKSGEKTSARDWPSSFEIKGRVRLDAFDKFLQELPKSRTRAMMVSHFALKEGSTDEEQANLIELIHSYVIDQRLGYAEPAPGVELYLCPPRSKTVDMMVKHLPNSYTTDLGDIDTGLVGVLVWRKEQVTAATLPKPSSQLKSILRGHPLTSGRHIPEKDAALTSKAVPLPTTSSQPPSNHNNDNEDDLPPGFGPPGGAKDDDDLPEFNFSDGTNPSRFPTSKLNNAAMGSHLRPEAPPRQMEKLRELIQKYGQSGNNTGNGIPIQPWNDDDDDIPEWQPHAFHQHQQSLTPQSLPTQKSVLTPSIASHPPLQRPLVPLAKPMPPLQANMVTQGAWLCPPDATQSTGSPRIRGQHTSTQFFGPPGTDQQRRDWRSYNASRRNNRGF